MVGLLRTGHHQFLQSSVSMFRHSSFQNVLKNILLCSLTTNPLHSQNIVKSCFQELLTFCTMTGGHTTRLSLWTLQRSSLNAVIYQILTLPPLIVFSPFYNKFINIDRFHVFALWKLITTCTSKIEETFTVKWSLLTFFCLHCFFQYSSLTCPKSSIFG